MKKALIPFVICFTLFVAQSQENTDSKRNKEILSPVINTDKTVTFRLEAKDAKKVLVQGDFLSSQGGNAELVKNEEGIWSFTSHTLPSELYSYTFIIDGVKTLDPNNVYFIRDVATVVNIFIIGDGKAENYLVKEVPHGTVSRRWYESGTLNTTRRITIYTPPDYEKSAVDYPVLYLLHGAGGDEEAWVELGRTSQIMDNLIAQGKVKPMLVVMTNGNSDQTAAPGESSDGFYKPVFIRPKMFAGETEASYPDVVQFIESNYRVKKNKASRAIAGLSMGGMHALVISANNPDMFDYVGVFSSAMLQQKEHTADSYANFENKLKIQSEKGYKLYWIGIGKTDFLIRQNIEFRTLLDSISFRYNFKETEGGHTWSNWRDYLVAFSPQLFR